MALSKDKILAKSALKDKFLLGDMVIITSGSAKGQKGLLKKKIRTRQGLRYVIEGCNMVLKHQKPNPQLNIEGGRKRIPASVHASNVAIFNQQTEKADKIKYVVDEKGKSRCYKSTGETITVNNSYKKSEG